MDCLKSGAINQKKKVVNDSAFSMCNVNFSLSKVGRNVEVLR